MATKLETTYCVEAFVRNGVNGVTTVDGRDLCAWSGISHHEPEAMTTASRLAESHCYGIVTKTVQRVTVTTRSVKTLLVELKKDEVKS